MGASLISNDRSYVIYDFSVKAHIKKIPINSGILTHNTYDPVTNNKKRRPGRVSSNLWTKDKHPPRKQQA